jgi:hypothetical protein
MSEPTSASVSYHNEVANWHIHRALLTRLDARREAQEWERRSDEYVRRANCYIENANRTCALAESMMSRAHDAEVAAAVATAEAATAVAAAPIDWVMIRVLSTYREEAAAAGDLLNAVLSQVPRPLDRSTTELVGVYYRARQTRIASPEEPDHPPAPVRRAQRRVAAEWARRDLTRTSPYGGSGRYY